MSTISVAPVSVAALTRYRKKTIYVRMAGEVDIAVEPALGDAIDRLVALTPQSVEVDLTLVTFGGTSLANFFARVYCVIPEGATMVVHGACPSVRRVLEATGIGELVSLR